MKKASVGVRDYISSWEYKLSVVICLVYSAVIFLDGYGTADGILLLLNDKIYLNFALFLGFFIYIYRNVQKDTSKGLLKNWVDNTKIVLSLSLFTFISLLTFSFILGEVFNAFNLGEGQGISPIIEKMKDYRDISVIQTFTGLSFLGVLTMTMAFEDFKGSKFLLIAFALYYSLRIFFPSNKNFLWILSPQNQLSAYKSLSCNGAGPYLMAILHCLGLVVIGNFIILIEKSLRKIK